jgi:hypothetical protein
MLSPSSSQIEKKNVTLMYKFWVPNLRHSSLRTNEATPITSKVISSLDWMAAFLCLCPCKITRNRYKWL